MEKNLSDFPWGKISRAKEIKKSLKKSLTINPKGLVSSMAEIGETTQARRGLGHLLSKHAFLQKLKQKVVWFWVCFFPISSYGKDWKKKIYTLQSLRECLSSRTSAYILFLGPSALTIIKLLCFAQWPQRQCETFTPLVKSVKNHVPWCWTWEWAGLAVRRKGHSWWWRVLDASRCRRAGNSYATTNLTS